MRKVYIKIMQETKRKEKSRKTVDNAGCVSVGNDVTADTHTCTVSNAYYYLTASVRTNCIKQSKA